jgi:hypothetical protein
VLDLPFQSVPTVSIDVNSDPFIPSQKGDRKPPCILEGEVSKYTKYAVSWYSAPLCYLSLAFSQRLRHLLLLDPVCTSVDQWAERYGRIWPYGVVGEKGSPNAGVLT